MFSKIDRLKGGENRSVSYPVVQEKHGGKRAFEFFDNRTETFAQGKLKQEMEGDDFQSRNKVIVNNDYGPVQLVKNKLSPKAEANRQRLLDKRKEKYSLSSKQQRAKDEFHKMIGTDGLDQYKFPFDNFNTAETVDNALDRLPIGMRDSETLRDITVLPDSAHGQDNERTHVNKGEFQEALAGWHFSNLRGLRNVRSMGAQIDFVGTDQQGREVPFDPFMSPLSGEGRVVNDANKDAWAQANQKGSYYKHTHSKGGDPNTVGVWDQTYSTMDQVSDLKGRLQVSGANINTNVQELRVPIAEAIAREHIAAEEGIEKSKKEAAAKMKKWAEVKSRYNKAQRRNPKSQHLTFEEALIDDSQLGRYWRTQV
ncbi:hypothetical protein DT73_09715 [Mangrovibacter sp. MFB070]|uniref:hypothetical protein n=1 Tax=Mangrovibacter sp. MFB070 TaxID=1224318 RepID=UPI0004D65D30|nr:hypothetical protein [Mangrovibacter sp. MFB070]KEA53003.1 hypothetical protein DT73_09715 [Mangrovibacter sp. MFB070]